MSLIFYVSIIDMDWVKTRHPIIQALLCAVKLQGFYTCVFSMPPDIQNWILFYSYLHQNPSLGNVLDAVPLLQSRLLQLDIHMGLIEQANQKFKNFSDQHYYQQEFFGTK